MNGFCGPDLRKFAHGSVGVIWPGGCYPPVFFDALTQVDVEVLSARRRFNSRIVVGVATRCVYGYPQVLLCRSLYGGKPFPTAFWLVCPMLERECGALESAHGVSELEAEYPNMAAYHTAHADLRRVLCSDSDMRCLKASGGSATELDRRGLGGIEFMDEEGNPRPFGAKCLHLHLASWLGWRYHPAASWLARKFPRLQCT